MPRLRRKRLPPLDVYLAKDPAYPIHGVTILDPLVIPQPARDVPTGLAVVARMLGDDLAERFVSDDGVTLAQAARDRASRRSFFALMPGERGKHGVVG